MLIEMLFLVVTMQKNMTEGQKVTRMCVHFLLANNKSVIFVSKGSKF